MTHEVDNDPSYSNDKTHSDDKDLSHIERECRDLRVRAEYVMNSESLGSEFRNHGLDSDAWRTSWPSNTYDDQFTDFDVVWFVDF